VEPCSKAWLDGGLLVWHDQLAHSKHSFGTTFLLSFYAPMKTMMMPTFKWKWLICLGWPNDEEILLKCCMSRDSFDFMFKQIKDHPVLKKLQGKTGCPQTPVSNQLMVFLECMHWNGME